MPKNFVRPLALASIMLAVLLTVSACSGSTSTTSTGDAVDENAIQILIGTSGSPKPYIYTTDDNELTGYDIQVVKEIDKLLEDYQFSFEITEFASIFGGIDSGRYQMGVNNLTKKPEREEKYLFANEYYVYNWTVAVVKAGRTDIKTIADLAGKKVYVDSSGGFAQLFFDSYNAQHPDNPILTEFSGADTIKVLTDIASGTVDFLLMEQVMVEDYIAQYPDLEGKIETVSFSQEETQEIQDPYGWFIYPKTADGEKTRDAVDEAIRTLASNGTLKALSEEYFGFDMTGR